MKLFSFLSLLLLIQLISTIPPGCPQDPVYYRCAFCENHLIQNSNSTTQLVCVCPSGYVLMAGSCFQISSFCHKITFQDSGSIEGALMSWNGIFGPGGTSRSYTFPNPLPDFMNNYVFNTDMPYLKQWVMANYIARIFVTEQNRMTLAQRKQHYADAVTVIQNARNLSVIERWQQYNSFIRTSYNLTYDVAQLVWRINSDLGQNALCECNSCYGVVYGSRPTTPISYGYNCQICPQNCIKCMLKPDGSMKCLQCYSPYQLSSTTFLCYLSACTVPYCQSCDDTGTNCYQCIQSYGKNDTVCVPCSANCLTCYFIQGSQSCVQCKFPYKTSQSQGQCLLCTQLQCRTCQNNNLSFCTQCDNGFYPNSTGYCLKCNIENCLMCTQQACMLCKQGFNKSISTGQCIQCPIGCSQCHPSLNICYSCFIPMYSLSLVDRRCYLSSYQPKNIVIASQLKPDFDIDGLCQPGCAYCYQSRSNYCAICQQNYYMVNQQCKKCPEGCVFCKNSTYCTKCLNYYTLSNNLCINCPANCQICTKDGALLTCNSCNSDYILSNEVCVLKTDKCKIKNFTDNTKCRVCQKGYTANDLGNCIKCLSTCPYSCNPKNISECRKQSSQNRFSTYFGDNALVIKGCLAAANSYCLYPMDGYILKNISNIVTPVPRCLDLCQQCTENECTTCISGFQLQNGKCVFQISCAGIPNCKTCSNSQCYQCIQGYYYRATDQTCQQCSGGCNTCIDATNCKTCKKGYYKDYNIQITYTYQFTQQIFRARKCLPCNSNCQTCNLQSNSCTSCAAGKKLIGMQCFSQYKVSFQFQIDIIYQTFLSTQQSQNLITQLSNLLNINRNNITITNLSSGSTIVLGTISSTSQTNANQILTTLSQTPIPNYAMISSTYTLVNSQDTVLNTVIRDSNNPYPPPSPNNNNNNQQINQNGSNGNNNNTNIGVIVGAVIGSVVGVAICGFIIYKIVKAKFIINAAQTQANQNCIPKESQQVVVQEGETQLHVNNRIQEN